MTGGEISADTAAEDEPARWQRIVALLIEPRIIGPLVGAAAVGLAALVIHEISGEIHLEEIGSALTATTLAQVLPALGFTLLSFAAMGMYDVLAAHHAAPGRVPFRLAAFAGMVGYGVSNAIGFHVFVGGPLRYRIYQTVGLDASDVGRIVGTSFLTFSAGLASIVGLSLLLDPEGIPGVRFLSPSDDRLIGAAIVAFLVLSLVWLATGQRRVSVLGWQFPLPSAGNAIAQILIGAIDIGAAAAALYMLLPADIAPGFAVFLVIFAGGIIAGIISHAPGGIGVLEATILLGLGAGTRPDVVAALIVFRIVYYFVPLGLAALAMVFFEAWRARHLFLRATNRARTISRRVVPPVASTLVFLGGLVLLLSGSLPANGRRTSFLSDLLPLPFAEASHLLASLVGLALIILARGLYNRMALARLVSIGLLLAGSAFSILKGLDYEESTVMLLVAGMLTAYPQAFYRKGDWRAFRPNLTWIALLAIVLAGITLTGFLAYRDVAYQTHLWWDFDWDGDAPRFLRATLALFIVGAAVAGDALLHRPQAPKPAHGNIPDAVRQILKKSSNTTAQIALLGDKHFMLAPDNDAFIMYAVSGRSWITMGDPVGDVKAGRRLVWSFAEAADRAGGRAVFYGVMPDMLPHYLDLGLSILKTGELARVPLADFNLEGKNRHDFRYAVKRAERDGLTFGILPKADVPAAMAELRSVSDEWLAHKSGHEKGFSLGRFDESYIAEFDCAVLRKDGDIVAFANLWQTEDRSEISIDLMRYRPGASKVIMDALFGHLLLYGRDQGYRWFNLGAAPLSGLVDHPLASTWNRVGTFIYRRGDEFYNFDGLRAFKQKFDPVWTPGYIALPGGLAMPQVLFDVTSLISGSPIGIIKR